MTAAMYENNRTTYKETISSVLITQDNSVLVVIGEKYHYVIDDFGNLPLLIKSPLHKKMEAGFDEFSVESDNRFSGELSIAIKEPTPEEYSEALKLGFAKKYGKLRLTFELSGTRYSRDNFVPSNKYQLNNQYTVLVSQPEGVVRKALKVAATPVTVALDGTLLLAGVPLFVVWCISY
jgi:hypothetical protein